MEYGITLNKIVDDILNDMSGGMPDDNYSREQIMFKVFRWRELLIRRDSEKNGVDRIHQQTIKCLPLELTDETICCTGTSGCKVVRSSSPIPRLIGLKKDSFIVTSTDDGSVYPAIRYTEAKRVGDTRFPKLIKRAYIKPDNYLYIINDKLVRKVNFTGLFFDPREAARFNNCDGSACYTNDDPFPLRGDLINVIYSEIMKETKLVNIYDEAKEKEEKTEAGEIENG